MSANIMKAQKRTLRIHRLPKPTFLSIQTKNNDEKKPSEERTLKDDFHVPDLQNISIENGRECFSPILFQISYSLSTKVSEIIEIVARELNLLSTDVVELRKADTSISLTSEISNKPISSLLLGVSLRRFDIVFNPRAIAKHTFEQAFYSAVSVYGDIRKTEEEHRMTGTYSKQDKLKCCEAILAAYKRNTQKLTALIEEKGLLWIVACASNGRLGSRINRALEESLISLNKRGILIAQKPEIRDLIVHLGGSKAIKEVVNKAVNAQLCQFFPSALTPMITAYVGTDLPDLPTADRKEEKAPPQSESRCHVM